MNVSVFITSYNQRRYLQETIESVLAQTLTPSQLIIVDDCSSDGSPELIAGFQSRYPNLITTIYHTQNTGVSQARIDALSAVTADYVTYVDGDDRYLPAKLEREWKVLESHPQAQIAFSNNYYVSSDGVRLWLWADGIKPPEGYVFQKTFARDFPRRSLYRMELVNYRAWQQIGFHDPQLRLYEDFDMRIRMTKYLQAVYCDEALSEVRLHQAGLSTSNFAQHFEAIDYINRKNRSLLNDVSQADREYVKQKFGEWIANIARRALDKSLDENRRLQAARLLLAAYHYDPSMLNWRLLMRILLPRGVYLRLAVWWRRKVTSH